jgi:hypothetical protein
MTTVAHRLALVVAMVAVVGGAAAGCVPDNRAPDPHNDQPAVIDPPLPTQQASPVGQIAGTASAIEAALATHGLKLAVALGAYRPSEPASLTTVPRAVYQVDLGIPDIGYVVIYELPDPDTATQRARDFADHLRNGLGQTNFPFDAQFALSQVGGTVVFTWWSPSRSVDDDTARLAFDTVAGVGQPITVTK